MSRDDYVELAKLFLCSVKYFGQYSGLVLNMNKTEAPKNTSCELKTIGCVILSASH